MKAGFIGLGAMGRGMAINLARAGHLAAVYNRSGDKASALAAELGIEACESIEQMAARVEVLFVCVSADKDVLAVVDAICKTVRAGSVVVDMSTVSGDTARQAAQRLAARHADFLDAPVSGGVEGARNASLAMMVGGDAQVLEQVRPLLAAMTKRIEHLGGVGAGQACKAVNQIMVAGINQAVTEALAFADAQDLPMDKVIDVIAGGAAGNWFLDHRGKTMTQGLFPPGFKLALHHKDLKIAQQMAQHAGMASPLTVMTLADYAKLMAKGYGDEDISALYRLKQQRNSN
ncbi:MULTISPECIES: NAD(P)-dependent oxidoreductase [unclassified Methylomonas]|uniref:NAD(P)-dependent oxidoreductase n=1 Tax=unclassified Methylomonas TaxID=2608980 RepID=UPI00247B1358|nr:MULTISPECIES: NAD(P)-dependent oxidoreductase [unclassified Methylomonas]MDT4331941.1 NAD(P)-dependent oxidoreductase [Methylomonas sp. MV1]WGS85898.1 NAD(P)-dependent oxidoreductase [Methylomonas sp. UP202]